MEALFAGLGYERWAINALLVLPLVGALLILAAPAARAKHVALVAALTARPKRAP